MNNGNSDSRYSRHGLDAASVLKVVEHGEFMNPNC